MSRSLRLPFRDGRDLKLTVTRPSRHDDVMPIVPLADVIADKVSLLATETRAVDGNVSPFEGLVLSAMVASRRPSRIFEIGTFDGRTTLMLAANAPAAEVYTLDLPADAISTAALTIGAGDVRYIAKEAIGKRIAEAGAADRISTLEGDSATFDYTPFERSIDFVFVDACHEYEYVLNDSRVALRLLRPKGGTIVWHDYSSWTGVTKALNELRLTAPFDRMARIDGTTLVTVDIPGGAT